MFDFPSSPAIGQSYSPSAGVTYQWDGQAWVNAGLLATASMIDRIYLTGVSTWNKPAGLAYAEVEGTAAGGSGSGAAATAAATFSGGSGGSAGAWGRKLFAASDLPSSVTITIGAPGAASTGAGIAGANTTFGSLITLPGGPAGAQMANTTASAVVGGVPSRSGDPVGVDIGAAGANGWQSILNWSGGNSQVGGGGLNPYGQTYPTWVTQNVSGVTGSGYGVGGSAAANGASQGARPSAAGQPGFIRVREFYTQVSAQVQTTAEERNRVVNPCMQVSQENGVTSSAAAASNAGYYTADQWVSIWSLSPGTMSAVSGTIAVPPDKNRFYTNLQVGTAKAALAAGDYAYLRQNIEGTGLQDLKWGRADAVPVVLRFWAWASIAGIYCVRVTNSAGDRNYPAQFTLPAAAWTKVELAIPGDTTGTWLADTSAGIRLDFVAAAGSTYVGTANAWQGGAIFAGPGQANIAANAANNFSLTDVGLYADPAGTGKAPLFQVPSYDEELRKSLRYYRYEGAGAAVIGGYANTALTFWYGHVQFGMPMRAPPTIACVLTTSGNIVGTPTGDLITSLGFRTAVQASAIGSFVGAFRYTANARL